jgi:hypothetical protein
MRIVLFLLIAGCAPPADQRDLSYTAAPRVTFGERHEHIPPVSSEEMRDMREKVRSLRAETEAMRKELASIRLAPKD